MLTKVQGLYAELQCVHICLQLLRGGCKVLGQLQPLFQVWEASHAGKRHLRQRTGGQPAARAAAGLKPKMLKPKATLRHWQGLPGYLRCGRGGSHLLHH